MAFETFNKQRIYDGPSNLPVVSIVGSGISLNPAAVEVVGLYVEILWDADKRLMRIQHCDGVRAMRLGEKSRSMSAYRFRQMLFRTTGKTYVGRYNAAVVDGGLEVVIRPTAENISYSVDNKRD